MTTLQVKVPDEVRDKARQVAAEQHISLDELATRALIEKLSLTRHDLHLEARARRADWQKFRKALADVPDVTPEDDDRLE